MPSKNQNTFFTSDFAKSFTGLPANLPFDMQSIMELQRKNFQALSEASQCAVVGMQAAAQTQTELMSGLLENNSKLAKEMMADGAPEDKVSKQADILKRCYEISMNEGQKMADQMTKSNQEVADVLNKRISASLNEMKDAIEKNKKTAKAA